MTKKVKHYHVKCAKCGELLIVTDQPNQLPCTCGSKKGFYKGHIVGWVWEIVEKKRPEEMKGCQCFHCAIRNKPAIKN